MLKYYHEPNLTVRLARNETEIRAAQRLRYRIFVEELGADAKSADHEAMIERDLYDEHAVQLCLFDQDREETDPENAVVGVCRLLDENGAARMGGFYSQSEFDLRNIMALSGRKLELGRFCVEKAHRANMGVAMLWQALGKYIRENSIEYLIGTASYHGAQIDGKLESLSHLGNNYLAPEELRAYVRPEFALEFTPKSPENFAVLDAMKATPSLIKSYLRLGGMIGEGAYVDKDFNTIDLFIIVPTKDLMQKLKTQ